MSFPSPLIDTLPDLKKALNSVENEKRIGFDLEADSMYHFLEKVCLIQVASKNTSFVIDTLNLRDLSPLKPIFMSGDIVKIFHGADYDIRSLYRDFGIEIRNLFDTELASRFLGVKETGLEAVLRDRFNVKIEKKYQKKDWSERPLSQEMLNYAINDVRHLVQLSELLEKELENTGRLLWVKEECEILCAVRPSENNGEPLFLKFKGAGKLDPRTLAVLEALIGYRSKMAKIKDRPPFKIMGNNSILKIAETKPDSLKRAIDCGALSRKQINMYGEDLVRIISSAVRMPENTLPVYPRKKNIKILEQDSKRIEALKKWREQKSLKIKIDPGLLLNNSVIAAIGIKNPDDVAGLEGIKDMKNWQRAEFGDEIIRILKRRR